MRAARLITAGLLVLTLDAHAFDLLPEYQGLNEAEMAAFTRPADIDSEYQTVINAYATPLKWEEAWQDRAAAMDLSVGSISNTRFLQYERLKIEVPWLDRLRFRFTFFAQRDREIDQVRHVLEIIQTLTPWLEFSLYGEPSSYKRENDIGAAAILKLAERWEHRIYYTSHDFTRNAHNDQDDYFLHGRNPQSFGWTGTWRGERARGRIGFRYDEPVAWMRPQEQRVFHYAKKLAFLDFDRDLGAGQALTARAQWDDTFKAQDPDSSSSPTPEEAWDERRAFLRLAYASAGDDAAFSLEPALMYAAREWTQSEGRHVQHFNLLPSVIARWRALPREGGFDHLQIAYEVTVFHTYGDLALTSPDQTHDRVEHRLQTAYEFHLRGSARLALALNFDMDEWTPAPTFEGGSAQFRADL
jgi:hypothetical protein